MAERYSRKESIKHKVLKKLAYEFFKKEYKVEMEQYYDLGPTEPRRTIDMTIAKNNKIIGLVECANTQTLKEAFNVIKNFPGRKIIVRYERIEGKAASNRLMDYKNKGLELYECPLPNKDQLRELSRRFFKEQKF